ncbi:hypothetical protein BD560DRAFT_383433 [Blakeslea trispora]|nr:hypothetical protein BD560DRAFT_383433 [Blakeslea trispora]
MFKQRVSPTLQSLIFFASVILIFSVCSPFLSICNLFSEMVYIIIISEIHRTVLCLRFQVSCSHSERCNTFNFVGGIHWLHLAIKSGYGHIKKFWRFFFSHSLNLTSVF